MIVNSRHDVFNIETLGAFEILGWEREENGSAKRSENPAKGKALKGKLKDQKMKDETHRTYAYMQTITQLILQRVLFLFFLF